MMYYVASRGGSLVRHGIFDLGYTGSLEYQGTSLSEARNVRDAFDHSMYAVYTLDENTMNLVEVKER
jgi:hypothetical protein